MSEKQDVEKQDVSAYLKEWYNTNHTCIEDFREAMFGSRKEIPNHKPSTKSQSLRQKAKRYVLGGKKADWGNPDFEPRCPKLCERAADGKGWKIRSLPSEDDKGGGTALELSFDEIEKLVGPIVWVR
jgi:hypothetical protein